MQDLSSDLYASPKILKNTRNCPGLPPELADFGAERPIKWHQKRASRTRGDRLLRCPLGPITGTVLGMKPFSMPELPPVLTDMQRRISEFMGSHSATDLQGPLRQALESALQRMDLVTREEFAQQQRLLALAEEKIAALEAMLAEQADARSSERSRST